MAKARWADGLRKGSTKTKTYSTLPTRKEGRVQIIKDRVYDVSNPQTDPQMLHRVCFVTASQAAAKMYDIISISQEGESRPEYARQFFISQNTELLKKAAYKRVGLARHYRAAYAPKGNQQLIPNSYQISKGSLEIPQIFVPNTGDNAGGSSFEYGSWDSFGKIVVNEGVTSYDTNLGPLTVGSTYNAAQLWQILFGLLPGDQLTCPQIYGGGIAQALYSGETEDSGLEDKTLITEFMAPRLVLLKEMPTTTITIASDTSGAAIQGILRGGIDTESSYAPLVDSFLGGLSWGATSGDTKYMEIDDSYDNIFGVGNGELRALGIILSRYDSTRKKWMYSTSNLVCIWDFLSSANGAYYFGFTVDNAIATYRASVVRNENGNFLQRGGSPDIVPPSFR
jgi:hypothetical protein